jgi:feruloyl-CoA synthase
MLYSIVPRQYCIESTRRIARNRSAPAPEVIDPGPIFHEPGNSTLTPIFAPPAVDVERRDDGTIILRSAMPLRACASRVGDWLEEWAENAPGRPFLFERGADAEWTGVNYGDARRRVRRLAAGLLRRRLSPERPIAIVSDNGIDHALLMLAAMHAGIPVAPVSPAYSLMSKDYAKLRQSSDCCSPE